MVTQRNIETALYNVFQHIGNNYEVPVSEFINDTFNAGSIFKNPFFGNDIQPVKFAKGTQKELDIWLRNTKDKYPVAWLVYPIESRANNNISTTENYPFVRLVFAMDNRIDKSVDERIHTTRVVLESIISKFLELMRQSHFGKYIYMSKQVQYKKTFYPNYATKEKQKEQPSNATIDVWDAITLDCELILIPGCIPVIDAE